MADALAHGTLHIPQYEGSPVLPLRLGVYAPTAALIRAFGLSEATLAAYPFLVSILGCLLAYAVARYLGTPLAGLIALGALAVLPIDVVNASLLYADAIAAFWANVGIALACVALDRAKSWQSALLGVASGGFFGVSWLCKEAVAYLVPFAVILVLVLRRQSRLSVRATCVIAIGIGSLAVLVAEAVFYGRLTGDFLFHLHATRQNYEQSCIWFFDESSPFYARALIKRLFIQGPEAMFLTASMCLVPAFAILGSARAIVLRQRSFAMPAVWLISLLLMFNFMSTSFSAYKPLPLNGRYLYLTLLPSLVLVGGFLAALLAEDPDARVRTERRFWGLAMIVVFCGMSGLGVRGSMEHRRNDTERSLAATLRNTDVVYTDYRTAANLVFFRTGALSPSNATTLPFEMVNQQGVPKGAYVLVNHDATEFLRESYKYKSPEFVEKPPSTWEKVWTHGDADLYVVGGK